MEYPLDYIQYTQGRRGNQIQTGGLKFIQATHHLIIKSPKKCFSLYSNLVFDYNTN